MCSDCYLSEAAMRLPFPFFDDNRDDGDHNDSHDNTNYDRIHTFILLSLNTLQVYIYLFRFFTKMTMAITMTATTTTPMIT